LDNLFKTGTKNLTAEEIKSKEIALAADGSLPSIGTSQKLSNAKIAATDVGGSGKAFAVLPESGAT
jgi:hypothetical protein